ncbi:hypothetical protein [Flavobacterium sp.]|uniref:hypothetical protein n=1 Tax=Flavobacterium sp. TaxID=239 RepID=UPI003D1326D5
MFKKNFVHEFNFSENSFLCKSEQIDFDSSIFVVYNKSELLDFLRLDKKGENVLVCLFNKQLYDSLSFLGEVKNSFLLDNFKTRIEIIKELRLHFKSKADTVPQISEITIPASNVISTKLKNFYSICFLDVKLF